MLARLQTADHIRQASPVQEEQDATALWHRARIMGLSMFEQEDPVALVGAHCRQGIFSALLIACTDIHEASLLE
jgi:hypothetical protein